MSLNTLVAAGRLRMTEAQYMVQPARRESPPDARSLPAIALARTTTGRLSPSTANIAAPE